MVCGARSALLEVSGWTSETYLYEDARNSLAVYDPATGRWTHTHHLYVGRHSHAPALLPNGQVLVLGGLGEDRLHIEFIAELYRPSRGRS